MFDVENRLQGARKEKIENNHDNRRQNNRAGRRASDADRAFGGA